MYIIKSADRLDNGIGDFPFNCDNPHYSVADLCMEHEHTGEAFIEV
jgi:hypothetical protein